MKKKCCVPGCNKVGTHKQHVFSGKVDKRKSLKPSVLPVCPHHENELNDLKREFIRNDEFELNKPWIKVGEIGTTFVLGRKKMIDQYAGTFCSFNNDLYEMSVESSNGVYVDQMKNWYLLISEDKSRRIAYALMFGTTY